MYTYCTGTLKVSFNDQPAKRKKSSTFFFLSGKKLPNESGEKHSPKNESSRVPPVSVFPSFSRYHPSIKARKKKTTQKKKLRGKNSHPMNHPACPQA